MTRSPYAGKPDQSWLTITEELIGAHPLKIPVLREAALVAWGTLWQTTVGSGTTSVRFSELRVPATIVGYFFEVLLVRELETRYQELWRGSQAKDEKDLVYVPDPFYSVEVKASGQAGFKIFGNRSYGQKSGNELLVKKEKSGFYVTVNFFRQSLTLLRFGWIDAEDWDPQEAPTGQMAGLKPAVYDFKLIALQGAYRQHGPLLLLNGVGPKTAEEFKRLGIHTIGNFLECADALPARFQRIKELNKDFLAGCYEQS